VRITYRTFLRISTS